jgi:hypothetical protein
MLPIMVIPALLATGLSLFVLLASVDNVAAKPLNNISTAPVYQVALTQEPEILMAQPPAARRELTGEMRNSRAVNPAPAKQTTDHRLIFHRVESEIAGNRHYAFS